MLVGVLFGLNLVVAAALVFVVWRHERLRSMVAFHATGLAVAAVLYATMVFSSAAWETKAGNIPAWLIFRVVVAAVAYVPFLVFLVVTYARTLGSIAGEMAPTAAMKLNDASQALRFGQEARAAKLAREVLEDDPDNIEARTLVAHVQLRHGRYEKAVGSYRLAMTAVRDDREFAQYVFTVAMILNEHLGNVQGAVRELDLIRKRMPDTPQAEKAQKWIVRMMDEAARDD